MSDETLLTLRQLAAQLDLPESTVRYYRDAFLDQIPSVGTGRRRRYPQQAVEVLRSIARSYAAGRSKREIVTSMQQPGSHPAAVAVPSAKATTTRALEEVTNLDLLAAILDGEREQRDALWQMAKEIVRLTDVLEGQDKVLNEIADQAGVKVAGRLSAGAAPALSAGLSAADAGSAPTAIEPPPATATWVSATAPQTAPEPAAPAPEPAASAAPRSAAHHDMDRLREELESERALVERLRESKLQLEHRAADAEAELQERRRSSVIRRIFRGDDQP
jgi:DNA-binding transcriptional MerR regulator